jgi:hypothetical protein
MDGSGAMPRVPHVGSRRNLPRSLRRTPGKRDTEIHACMVEKRTVAGRFLRVRSQAKTASGTFVKFVKFVALFLSHEFHELTRRKARNRRSPDLLGEEIGR